MAKLLVADENEDEADALAETLRKRGYTVRTAYSEGQCLSLVGEFRPSVVLLFLPDADLGRRVGGRVAVIGAGRMKKPLEMRGLLRMIRDASPA
jgi:CheY-like chemotaxis protein